MLIFLIIKTAYLNKLCKLITRTQSKLGEFDNIQTNGLKNGLALVFLSILGEYITYK